MKLITLNMWGGQVVQPLTDFLKKNSDIEIFCFQEIYDLNVGNIRPDAINWAKPEHILTNHNVYYRRATEEGFGLAIFIRKDITPVEEGDTFVYGHKDKAVGEKWWLDVGKNMQYMTIQSDEKTYNIFNIHGLWDPSGKIDTPNRLKQSENIVNFIQNFKGSTILCGDFNLRPDTESLKIIERELGLRNLITEYKVPSTRTSLYTRSPEKFADYVFVSPGLMVKDFKVLPDEVSDHAALYLEF